MVAIALFIASEYMIVGVVLALWALFAAVVIPVARGIGYLAFHARLRRHRARALATSAAVVGRAGSAPFRRAGPALDPRRGRDLGA